MFVEMERIRKVIVVAAFNVMSRNYYEGTVKSHQSL